MKLKLKPGNVEQTLILNEDDRQGKSTRSINSTGQVGETDSSPLYKSIPKTTESKSKINRSDSQVKEAVVANQEDLNERLI